MYFPWFIAKRFILSRKDSRFINLITGISIVGIALGVATLVIAVSVLRGFEKTITDKIVDFDSHIKVTSFRSTLPDYQKTLPTIETELKNYDPKITPFASKLVIVSSKKTKEGLNLIGIPDDSQPSLTKNIVEGKFDLSESSIVIGKKLADKLFLRKNDQITVFALKQDQIPSPENIPNIKKYKVAGIFESGMANYDDNYAYVSLKSAQNIFEIGDNITGYNIKLGDISKIDSLTRHLGKTLRYPHAVRSIFQIHRNIFTWIELQKEPIPLIIALIILVAVFNIVGTLLMIVLEKTNAVGVLKSIGAKRKQIIFVFLIKGVLLGLGGIILGNLLGYVLMKIQIELNIIKIPSSVYFMTKVPFLISYETFVLISAITFVLCIAASVIPSVIASRIKPITALRFS
ncbi:MAG: ABC transporter permease [Ignavibacteria bacterium]|nr:ABC transporter permease [Ignavibacteria bacterium]MBT8381999.1 ABC transporter permease [Ignavibacteria bacterium]MBT8390207.1 ABC transporter permease [Ignavibacteria bacterium]NNJ53466.1 ABC transporter permease [Ignavibacteriaceae bacterium]NNL21191.1 ABC transporter permease [Ignavibacteriaceae bacterium]